MQRNLVQLSNPKFQACQSFTVSAEHPTRVSRTEKEDMKVWNNTHAILVSCAYLKKEKKNTYTVGGSTDVELFEETQVRGFLLCPADGTQKVSLYLHRVLIKE